jgi:hypothetical protein
MEWAGRLLEWVEVSQAARPFLVLCSRSIGSVHPFLTSLNAAVELLVRLPTHAKRPQRHCFRWKKKSISLKQ